MICYGLVGDGIWTGTWTGMGMGMGMGIDICNMAFRVCGWVYIPIRFDTHDGHAMDAWMEYWAGTIL